MIPIHVLKKIGYLWFLPALFLNSITAFPLLKWSQRRYAGKPCTFMDDYILILYLAIYFVIWTIGITFILPTELRFKYNLPSNFILFGTFMCLFFVPHNLVRNRENGYKYSLLLRFISIICTILLCVFHDGSTLDAGYIFVSMMNFDLMFMSQAIVD